MNEWNIQSRAHACHVCAKPFAHKELFHTLLQTVHHDLERLDICPACWQTQYALDIKERKGYISHWQCIYHAPAAAAPEPIQKETAETLLRKLIEAGDPKHGPACYILAVMLERKRLLKIKEQIKREGARVFIYEHPKTGDLFTITDPNLQLGQLEEVQRDVANLLAHGLTPPPQPVEPPPAQAAVQENTPAPQPQPESVEPHHA
jgi:hypothetical protein